MRRTKADRRFVQPSVPYQLVNIPSSLRNAYPELATRRDLGMAAETGEILPKLPPPQQTPTIFVDNLWSYNKHVI